LSAIQKVLAEDEPYINLWYPDNVCVRRTRVASVRISPLADFDFLSTATLQ
jgi:ABC-type transport system substrate-binding protein